MYIIEKSPRTTLYNFRFFTDIVRGFNNTETRRQLGILPNLEISYSYLFNRDDGIEQRQRDLLDLYAEYMVPYVLDQVTIFRDNPIDNDTSAGIVADMTKVQQVIQVDDFVFVNSQYRKVTTLTDDLIIFDSHIDTKYKRIFNIIPALKIQRFRTDNQTSIYPTQATVYPLNARARDHQFVMRNIGNIEHLEGIPILNKIGGFSGGRSTQRQINDQSGIIVDFGTAGPTRIFSDQQKSTIRQTIRFDTETPDEWQDFKNFIFFTSGRLNSFLFTSRLQDLKFVRFQNTRRFLTFEDTSNISIYFDPGQRLLFHMPSGNKFHGTVLNVFKTSATARNFIMELEYPLFGSEEPISVSFVDVCRLASDQVQVRYANGTYTITLNIQTIIERETRLPDNLISRSYDDSYDISYQ